MLIILSAPSGCGKSSIAQRLLKLDNNLILSISATTRAARCGEIEGTHYFFKNNDEFKKVDFLESATIHGNSYGTPQEFIEQKLSEGKNILFDIDYQGAKQIMESAQAKIISTKIAGTKIVSIFILPPDIETLRSRMINRGQDNIETINLRIASAASEMQNASYYKYQVINNDFDQAVREIQDIILFERKNK